MIALYNDEISNIAERLRLPLVSVCNKNKLPQERKQGMYVVNLENDYDKYGNKLAGSHWVCFSLMRNNSWYFDSMGCDLMPLEIERYLNAYNVYKNDDQVQSLGSEYCGHFCLAAMYYMHHHHGQARVVLNRFTDMFYHDLDSIHNYKILKKYLNSILD